MPRKKTANPKTKFPLFLHASGQWAKKIAGKLYYFGTDKEQALAKYLKEKDELQAGINPRIARPDYVSVAELANQFLTHKRAMVDAGELTMRTWRDYHDCLTLVLRVLGNSRPIADLTASDFERLRSTIAKGRGPVSIGNQIQRVRTIFNFAFEMRLVTIPTHFGPSFKKPSRKLVRKSRQALGPRMFEADEIRSIIETASLQLRAMTLLGINAGFGQSDCSGLPIQVVDLKTGWINFPRPKTGVPRRFPLWPETVSALREAIEQRPQASDEADREAAFITKYGARWIRSDKGTVIDSVGLQFGKLLRLLGIKRDGVSFYALRHTFRTVAGNSRDERAIDAIMGHAREDMGSVYTERIDDSRLKAVTDLVRVWLWHPPLLAPADRSLSPDGE